MEPWGHTRYQFLPSFGSAFIISVTGATGLVECNIILEASISYKDSSSGCQQWLHVNMYSTCKQIYLVYM
ncbi:hypothetical protein DM02DRAFT_273437 [Periconia macrospinosa]|uniref:Uncharacterized protein n=1 Tax=Periconia macrospinosa TaxID=97972 RepID=A0A2V1DX16_9PLEO|nr:hypothetical protein DM02DRAFT_273437 [Periconia macrospinosa]